MSRNIGFFLLLFTFLGSQAEATSVEHLTLKIDQEKRLGPLYEDHSYRGVSPTCRVSTPGVAEITTYNAGLGSKTHTVWLYVHIKGLTRGTTHYDCTLNRYSFAVGTVTVEP